MRVKGKARQERDVALNQDEPMETTASSNGEGRIESSGTESARRQKASEGQATMRQQKKESKRHTGVKNKNHEHKQ